MKKIYTNPIIEIEEIELSDIILESGNAIFQDLENPDAKGNFSDLIGLGK